MDGIKKSFIGSGVRYDLLFPEWNQSAGRDEGEYLEELIRKHVSGRLKVAPEHTSPQVLSYMRKVPFELFRKLKKRFDNIKTKFDLKSEMIPYFISAHPGCTDADMKDLEAEVKSLGIKPEQVQDFTPTPMTLSTLMYYTGIDPYTGKKVYVARSVEDKKKQKEYFFWYNQDKGNKGHNGVTKDQRRKGATAQRFKGKPEDESSNNVTRQPSKDQRRKGTTGQGFKGNDKSKRRHGPSSR
jgi:radical SAM superfamily enzyme YgiQ (UPF0313 family)